jgi:hypothetical protein
MSSSGYSQADRDEFTWAVTIWDEGVELGESGLHSTTGCDQRSVWEVVACGRARSEPLINVGETIGQNAKAFDRMRGKL